jgi:hypothetical protein
MREGDLDGIVFTPVWKSLQFSGRAHTQQERDRRREPSVRARGRPKAPKNPLLGGTGCATVGTVLSNQRWAGRIFSESQVLVLFLNLGVT